MSVAIADIKIGKRYRKDLGDIAALAESITKLGLLHPVVVTSENLLIVGRRRLAAYKHLKRDTIPVTVAANLTELTQRVDAENEENTCRKDFLPSEGYEIAQRVAKAFKPAAEKAEKKGGRPKGSKGKKGGGNSPTIKKPRDESKRTASVAAKAAGVDRRTLWFSDAKKLIASIKA